MRWSFKAGVRAGFVVLAVSFATGACSVGLKSSQLDEAPSAQISLRESAARLLEPAWNEAQAEGSGSFGAIASVLMSGRRSNVPSASADTVGPISHYLDRLAPSASASQERLAAVIFDAQAKVDALGLFADEVRLADAGYRKGFARLSAKASETPADRAARDRLTARMKADEDLIAETVTGLRRLRAAFQAIGLELKSRDPSLDISALEEVLAEFGHSIDTLEASGKDLG